METGGHANGLMPGPAELEIGSTLPLELKFLFVQPPGKIHRPVNLDKLTRRKRHRFLCLNSVDHRASPEEKLQDIQPFLP